MPVEVVDASALGAVLFDEPEADRVVDRVGAGRLKAPVLLDFELSSICLKKMRLHPERREVYRRAMALRARMPIEIMAVEYGAVVALAETTGLTAYDASYLWLARLLGAGLITLDRRLAAAAGL
jgi:predicted nucleic acid-binding protein